MNELTSENLLKIVVTSDELREVNVYKVCVQPLDGSEFTVHVDVAACRISDLKSQIRAKNGTWRSRVKHSTMMVWAEKVQEVRRSVARSNGFDRKRWPRRWDLERADERISQSRW